MFGKHKEVKPAIPSGPLPMPQPHHTATMLEKLSRQRADLETDLVVLTAKLKKLDEQIAELERVRRLYPGIEQLIESLRG